MQGPRFNSQYQKQKKGCRYVSHQSSDSWEIGPRNGQSLGKKQDRRAPHANSRRLVLMESWPRQRQCQGKRQEAGPEGWLEMYRAMQPCQGLKQSVRGNEHRSQQAGTQRCQVLGGGTWTQRCQGLRRDWEKDVRFSCHLISLWDSSPSNELYAVTCKGITQDSTLMGKVTWTGATDRQENLRQGVKCRPTACLQWCVRSSRYFYSRGGKSKPYFKWTPPLAVYYTDTIQ